MEEIQSKAIQKILKRYITNSWITQEQVSVILRLWWEETLFFITAHDRIIYEIHDEVITVLVLDVEGHYNDK